MIENRPHKRLKLWKKCIELVTHLYEVTKVFPREEEFGLKSQLRRAAVSVPSNIAEGLTRFTKKDKLHFLNISQGSLSEVDAQAEICLALKIIDQKVYDDTMVKLLDVQMLLSGLIRSLR
ncbi:MAG TPA: four helix bundle protein [Bacteroidota bacterium]